MTLTREDILISRIVDGSAQPADWEELKALAESDPEILRRLAAAQRLETALREELALATNAADEIELPESHSATVYAFRSRLQAWTGWAAAAVIALAWLTGGGMLRGGAPAQGVAGWSGPASTEEAFEQYQIMGFAEGRVVGELPLVLIQTERLQDGRTQVTYLRRVLERRFVTDVFEPGVDESGRPTLTPATIFEIDEAL